MTTAVAYSVARKDRAEELGGLAVDEARFGNHADKVTKIQRRVLGVLADLRATPTVGVVAEDPERGLTQIAKPVGVVAALVPTTGLDATPPVKACGIHTTSDASVDALATGTRTARVLVNQNLNEGVGSPLNGLPFTLSLGCGTWGGTITTENINARHFVNLTWVSRPIPTRVIDADALFADHIRRYGP